VLLDGKILDGRNRYLACERIGIEPKTVEYDLPIAPEDFVWSLNAERRDLSEGMRAAARMKLAEYTLKAQQKRFIARMNKSAQAKAKPRSDDGAFIASPGSVDPGLGHGEAKSLAARTLAEEARVSPATADRVLTVANKRPDIFEKVASGELTPTAAMRIVKRDEIGSKLAALPEGKFRVFYADPPWSYGNTQPDYHSEQRDHYPTMSLSDICAMPIKDMAHDDAVLFLWVTSPILEEAFQVIRAWGFKYKASFVWDKVKHNMGHYNSVRHEFLLICARGSCQPDVQKLFDSVVVEERGKHSEKPAIFYDMIETLYVHGDKIELFARKPRNGWTSYGNEVVDAVG
jgi:N6-adenosine-specific RNA methylase IME4